MTTAKRISAVFLTILAIISVSFFWAKFSDFFFCRVDDVISSLYFYANQSHFVSCRFETEANNNSAMGYWQRQIVVVAFLFFSTCSLLILRTVSSCERSDSTITASLRWIVCPLRGFLYSSCSASVKTGAGHVYLP